MLRVAFIAPFGLGQKTTVWARTLPLARFLARQGHAVTILIPPWDTPADAGKVWVDEGVQVVNVGLGGGLPLIVARLLRHLDAFQPQLVHIVKPRAHAGLVQWLLWQRRRVISSNPRLLLDVDDWEQAWAAINPYPPLVARFLAWQEEWGIRHTDGITAASHWLVDRVQQYAPQTPVCYVPNGVVAPTAPLPASPTKGEQVLFFSRYTEVQPVWLAEFWCALVKVRPHAQLIVFGDPLAPGRSTLFQTSMTTHCPAAAQQVTWLPYDAQVMPHLIAESGCVMFPSEKTPLHEAKCSVKLATTLLQGAPVVASTVGEQAYYGAAGAAHLVAADATPAEFAAAVAQVLADPGRQAALRQQGQQRLLATYDWAQLGAKLEQFYMEIVR
jgi:glycosyltransferase involved in cell wall biosynthesis